MFYVIFRIWCLNKVRNFGSSNFCSKTFSKWEAPYATFLRSWATDIRADWGSCWRGYYHWNYGGYYGNNISIPFEHTVFQHTLILTCFRVPVRQWSLQFLVRVFAFLSLIFLILTYLLTYSMVQQPLKSFERPLMRIPLSNSILVTLIFY